jgi:hypothetical protein
MLFFFRGRYKEPARLVLGILLVVAGLLIHHGVLLVALGAVLGVWGVFGTAMLRRRGRGPADRPGRGDQDGGAR